MINVSQLPVRRTICKDIDTLIDYVNDSDKEELYYLVRDIASEGGGLSRDQFQTRKQLEDLLAEGVNICFKDMGNTGKLFAYFTIYPSHLCRSNVPILCGGEIFN